MEKKIPLYWVGAAFTVIALVFALGWFLYHPMWDRAATWGFDKPFNASRALLAYICMIAMLMLAWLWKIWLRRGRSSDKNHG